MRRQVLARVVTVMLFAVMGCVAEQISLVTVRVTDMSGAKLREVHVLLRANSSKTMVSDIAAIESRERLGEYSIPLKPGVYDVFLSGACVMPFVTQIKTTEGKPLTVRAQMKPQFDAASAEMSGCVGADDFGTPLDFNLYEPPLPGHIPPAN